jgi:hypothetical protein
MMIHGHRVITTLFVSLHSGDSNGKCSVGIWEEMIPFEVTPQGRPSIIVTGYSEKMEMTESVRERERETYDQSAARAALEQQ